MFQSTFPRGERPKQPTDGVDADFVSIHVPARGTTRDNVDGGATEWFQSTFPRGERQDVLDSQTKNQKFQSTFPRGERPVT